MGKNFLKINIQCALFSIKVFNSVMLCFFVALDLTDFSTWVLYEICKSLKRRCSAKVTILQKAGIMNFSDSPFCVSL